MHFMLTVLVCLSLSGSTWGWRLPYIVNGRDATIGEFPWQHPAFNSCLSDPDIGLIKLAKDATLDGTYVDTIALAPADIGALEGADCVISGWGTTKIGSGGEVNVLKAANTRPLSYAACEAAIADYPDVGPGVVTDGHICVGGVDKEGSCHGDSGGPLVCKMPDGSQVLAGAYSWGHHHCSTSYPNVYTRVSHYRTWLSDNSGGEV